MPRGNLARPLSPAIGAVIPGVDPRHAQRDTRIDTSDYFPAMRGMERVTIAGPAQNRMRHRFLRLWAEHSVRRDAPPPLLTNPAKPPKVMESYANVRQCKVQQKAQCPVNALPCTAPEVHTKFTPMSCDFRKTCQTRAPRQDRRNTEGGAGKCAGVGKRIGHAGSRT